MRSKVFGSLWIPTAVLLLATAAPAEAKLPWVKKAQSMGFSEIKNCASCHESEKPGKNGEPFAERGKWLKEQKAAKKAEEVDLAWLKSYPKK